MLKVKVRVKYFSILACRIGQKEHELYVSSDIKTALKEINNIVDVPLLEEINAGKLAVLLNGKSIGLSENEAVVKENDTLAILPIMGGG